MITDKESGTVTNMLDPIASAKRDLIAVRSVLSLSSVGNSQGFINTISAR
jgi:hypothetical protein